jgi:hypothetical protein
MTVIDCEKPSRAPATARAVPPAPRIRALVKDVKPADSRADINPEPSVDVPCHMPSTLYKVLAEPMRVLNSSKVTGSEEASSFRGIVRER